MHFLHPAGIICCDIIRCVYEVKKSCETKALRLGRELDGKVGSKRPLGAQQILRIDKQRL